MTLHAWNPRFLSRIAAVGVFLFPLCALHAAAAPQSDDPLGCDSGCCFENSCSCSACCWGHRSSILGEFLYLQPAGVDVAHAQQQNGLGGAGTVPFGDIGTVEPDYQPGFRAGFNYALDSCSSITASYSRLESDAADTVVPPAIPAGAVGSLVHHPGTLLTGSVGPVVANYDVDFDMVEVSYRRLWCGSEQGWMNYSLGVKYGHLEQELLQSGIFGGALGGSIDTSSQISFDGSGLTIGTDFERLCGRCGLSVYGRGSVSALVGKFQSDYQMVNTTTGVQLARSQWEDDRFVSMLEYELGVAWTGRHLRLSAGYCAMFWFDAVTTPEFISAVQNDSYVNLGDTFSFDGLVARLEFAW